MLCLVCLDSSNQGHEAVHIAVIDIDLVRWFDCAQGVKDGAECARQFGVLKQALTLTDNSSGFLGCYTGIARYTLEGFQAVSLQPESGLFSPAAWHT